MNDMIDVNQLSNALQQKIDLPSGKSQADIDYVVEWKAPTSSDPTWYRLYKSGWVEQGGTATSSNTTAINVYKNTITFLKPFESTAYTFLITSSSNDDSNYYLDGAFEDKVGAYNRTTTNITFTHESDVYFWNWEAKGMSAQS